MGFSAQGAEAMLQALITATMSFVVFTFGSMLVAIQVASGQLTPRIIATTLLQDNVVRYSVGLFVFAFLYVIAAAGRMDTRVDQLAVFVAACLGVACIGTLLYLIDYAAKLLRPITILARVSRHGLAVIESVYPETSIGPHEPQSGRETIGPPARTIYHQGASQVVLAIRVGTLLTKAEKSNGVIEFIPQVGDFVAVDEPLFNLYGGAAAIDERDLRGDRVRARTHDRARPDLCLSHRSGPRAETIVSGDKRPDDGGTGDRSASPPAAGCRPATFAD